MFDAPSIEKCDPMRIAYLQPEDGSIPVRVAMRYPNPVCVRYVHTTHETLFTKCGFLKRYFYHVRRLQVQFDRRVLMTVKPLPIKSKVNSPLEIAISFSTVFNGC